MTCECKIAALYNAGVGEYSRVVEHCPLHAAAEAMLQAAKAVIENWQMASSPECLERLQKAVALAEGKE